jgi:hypothetical protein
LEVRVATDYDTPRDAEATAAEQTASLDALRAQVPASESVVEDEANLLEDLELPGADLSSEVLSVAVVPQLADEFACERCFLVQHRTRRAKPGVDICVDCA